MVFANMGLWLDCTGVQLQKPSMFADLLSGNEVLCAKGEDMEISALNGRV